MRASRSGAGKATTHGALRLVAIGEDVVMQCPIPEVGEVTIGRGRDVDVRIDAPSISRRHALLRIEKTGELAIEDLGSANGTRVRGELLARGRAHPLKLGEVVDLGSVLVTVQRLSRATAARAAPYPHDAMRDLQRLVERVAPSTISVLILGETGVGKEVLAESVHLASRRAGKPYLKLNCAALSESLLESELFGHEKGAFTGAVQTKPGLLETADGGTVFLDELGELPMAVQIKLLRVIEERAVLRVGGLKPRAIDVRFVAATNRDLESEIRKGTFREDLYFRINGVTLVIPPLRERVDEIAGLARAFVANAWGKLERPGERPPRLTPEALALLEGYAWPGNIRELRNVVERAVLLSSDGVILPDHLPADRLRGKRAAPASPAAPAAPSPAVRPAGASEPRSFRQEIEALEKQRIVEALAECAGNQTHAARLLGISRAALVNRLDLYGIKRPRKRPR